MNRLFVDGIIYKLVKYTDSSAIALAYTADFGKVKLFVPKAISKKGGVLTLLLGELDFLKKENSDLNKLYAFNPHKSFLHYIDTPSISIRLTLFLDVIDNLYELDQHEPILWNLLQKFTHENAGKLLIYSIYVVLVKIGIMFGVDVCSNCGARVGDNSSLYEGVISCKSCSKNEAKVINFESNLILRAFSKADLYRNMKVTLKQECDMLDVLIYHIESVTNKKIKSYKSFKQLIYSL